MRASERAAGYAGADGVAVTPDQLVPQVYLPNRKGSLQAELVAATRSYQRVALSVDTQTTAITA